MSLTLRVNLPGAHSYAVGDEISDEMSLADAIAQEAQTIADGAGAELLFTPGPDSRDRLRRGVIAEMTAALVNPGDTYTAPDGVGYCLIDE